MPVRNKCVLKYSAKIEIRNLLSFDLLINIFQMPIDLDNIYSHGNTLNIVFIVLSLEYSSNSVFKILRMHDFTTKIQEQNAYDFSSLFFFLQIT